MRSRRRASQAKLTMFSEYLHIFVVMHAPRAVKGEDRHAESEELSASRGIVRAKSLPATGMNHPFVTFCLATASPPLPDLGKNGHCRSHRSG